MSVRREIADNTLDGASAADNLAYFRFPVKSRLEGNSVSIVSFDSSRSEFVTDSLLISEALKKPHHVIMKSLHKLSSKFGAIFSQDKLILSDYIDSRGKTQPKYLLTQKGVILLMSRMQDQLPWLEKLCNTFDKLQKELIRKIPNNKLNQSGVGKVINLVKDEYGSRPELKEIPYEDKTILITKSYAEENGIPSGRQPLKDFSKIQATEIIIALGQAQISGRLDTLNLWKMFLAALHKDESTTPEQFKIKTQYIQKWKATLAEIED